MGDAEGYDIALRMDDQRPDLCDDIVVKDVEMFRAEDMGDFWWLCCYLPGGDRITWHITRRGKRMEMRTIEFPSGFRYEEGPRRAGLNT